MNSDVLKALSKDDLVALILAQQVQIAAQAVQIGALTARIAELETRLDAPRKTPGNSSTPPSKGQKPNRPERPKKPRCGRPGVTRALAVHPDRVVEAMLDACPHCEQALGPADQPAIHAYDHIDLPPISPVVTRINRHRGVCPCCRKRVSAAAPEGFQPGSPFGPGLRALIIHLHVTQAIGFERLVCLLSEVFGLTLSGGAIANILARAEAPLLAAAAPIAAAVRESPVVGSDEGSVTNGRVPGCGQVCWRGSGGWAMADAVFKGRHFAPELILLCVRWYCRYGVSYRDLEQMMAERGVGVDHSTVYRWVQRYAPEVEKRLRWQWRSPRSTSWRVDETYVKVGGKWAYLYRALDKQGSTIDFYLSPTRNTAAAKRFLGKALRGLKDWEQPTVINTDKAASYGAAIAELKKEGKLGKEVEHRQAKYLNNVVEADHGKLKQLIRPVRGFKTLKTAYAAIKGFEVMRALRKGQASAFNLTRDMRGEARLVERAFGVGADALADAVQFINERLKLQAA